MKKNVKRFFTTGRSTYDDNFSCMLQFLCWNCMIYFFQPKDQNVQLILNARIILHAYVKNVKTPASPLHVESMLNAG